MSDQRWLYPRHFIDDPPPPGYQIRFNDLPRLCRGCIGPMHIIGHQDRQCPGRLNLSRGKCRVWNGSMLEYTGLWIIAAHGKRLWRQSFDMIPNPDFQFNKQEVDHAESST